MKTCYSSSLLFGFSDTVASTSAIGPDSDLQFGDMAYMLGRDNAISLADVIEEPERIAQVSPEDGLPAVIAAPERLEQSELIVSHMGLFLERS